MSSNKAKVLSHRDFLAFILLGFYSCLAPAGSSLHSQEKAQLVVVCISLPQMH